MGKKWLKRSETAFSPTADPSPKLITIHCPTPISTVIYALSLINDFRFRFVKHNPQLECLENTDLENAGPKITSLIYTYKFDENNLRVALTFPIVFRYWRADFAFFSLIDI